MPARPPDRRPARASAATSLSLVSRSIPTSTARRVPILLAVDQELGEGSALRVAPELANPIGAIEVGEHQDLEQLGAGSGAKHIEALS
jgi:hypothetical protein